MRHVTGLANENGAVRACDHRVSFENKQSV